MAKKNKTKDEIHAVEIIIPKETPKFPKEQFESMGLSVKQIDNIFLLWENSNYAKALTNLAWSEETARGILLEIALDSKNSTQAERGSAATQILRSFGSLPLANVEIKIASPEEIEELRAIADALNKQRREKILTEIKKV